MAGSAGHDEEPHTTAGRATWMARWMAHWIARVPAMARTALTRASVVGRRLHTATAHASTVGRQVLAPLAALSLFASAARGATDLSPQPLQREGEADAAPEREPVHTTTSADEAARANIWGGRSARVRIVVNPTSGGGRGAALIRTGNTLIASLAARGLMAEICPTTGPGSARHLAEQAVRQGADMVVAAGGDGTINEVIQALVNHTTALGVLPLGTVNVWAREVGIPQSVAGACRVLVDGVRRRIDVGRANTRYFLLMAGIGIDAEITRRVERHWLKRVGLKLLGYIAAASYVGFTERPHRFTVRRGTQRRTAHAVQILIGNTRLWGGAIELAQRALADDGWLDVVFVGGHHLRHRVNVVVRAALHRRGLGPGTRYETVRTVHLESATPLAVQADGELIGHLPMTFAIQPRALTVLVPRDAPSRLFLHPPLDE